MDIPELPEGHIRVLIERPKDPLLIEAAERSLAGEDPAASINGYIGQNASLPFIIDASYGAIAIGAGGGSADVQLIELQPQNSARFLVRAFVKASSISNVPRMLDGELVHSDPAVGATLTCINSRAVGSTHDVRTALGCSQLNAAGCDGARVAIAIVDTGIDLNRIIKLLGDLAPGPAPAIDAASSWKPSSIATTAFKHALGHGTMCAYDALIAAPKATLIDVPMLLDRSPGDHGVPGTVGAAIKAYWHLANKWLGWLAMGKARPYDALVISNSWGIFNASLDNAKGPLRFVDNPHHIFRLSFVRPLSFAGVDIVFASNNCGPECPSATCLSQTSGTIMGANAYQEVLTVGGCDIHNDRVGYSSLGPSISGCIRKSPISLLTRTSSGPRHSAYGSPTRVFRPPAL